MSRLKAMLRNAAAKADGAVAIEYGLIVALMVVATIGAMNAFGGANSGQYNYVSDEISDAIGSD